MLGKVFGYAAIVRCKRPIDQETAVKCAEGLVHIANKKSFLRELAANVLLDLTGDLPEYCGMHACSTACIKHIAAIALTRLCRANCHICIKQQLKSQQLSLSHCGRRSARPVTGVAGLADLLPW